MAQPLQSINLVAPAFQGINTEDSPIAQDTSFAEIADNAIIDRQGRLASRQGNKVITTNKILICFSIESLMLSNSFSLEIFKSNVS